MTGRIEHYEGMPMFIPNNTFDLEDSGCYVSYSQDTRIYGCDTTALVRMDNIHPTKFLILNGNHTKEYYALGSYAGCVEYFKQHLDQQNDFSENWDEELIFDSDGNLQVRKETTKLC